MVLFGLCDVARGEAGATRGSVDVKTVDANPTCWAQKCVGWTAWRWDTRARQRRGGAFFFSFPSANLSVWTERMSETGEDCHFFMTTGCSKGAECSFRHSTAAKETTTVCRHWLSNSCSKLGCTFRHPTRQAAATPPAAVMGMGMMGAPPPNMCVFFMKGKCNKGANCPFLHHFMDPFQMQMQLFQQQQMQQLAQQQMQQGGGFFEETQTRPQKRNERGQKSGGNGGGRVVRGEAEEEKKKQPKEKRPLSETEKEALLAKPLQAGSVSKKFKDKTAPVVIAKTEAPQSKRAKPDRASLASGAPAASPAPGAPVQIKSLAQIMADKQKEKSVANSAGAAPVKAVDVVKKKRSQEAAVDEELLAMGLDPSDLEMGGDDVDIVM